MPYASAGASAASRLYSCVTPSPKFSQVSNKHLLPEPCLTNPDCGVPFRRSFTGFQTSTGAQRSDRRIALHPSRNGEPQPEPEHTWNILALASHVTVHAAYSARRSADDLHTAATCTRPIAMRPCTYGLDYRHHVAGTGKHLGLMKTNTRPQFNVTSRSSCQESQCDDRRVDKAGRTSVLNGTVPHRPQEPMYGNPHGGEGQFRVVKSIRLTRRLHYVKYSVIAV